MGLDICLIRPCPIEEADKDYNGEAETTRNPKVVRAFQRYVVIETDEEYDFEALGHPEFDDDKYWETHGWFSTDDTFYVIDNPDHTGSGDEGSWEYIKEQYNPKVLFEFKYSDIPTKQVQHMAVPYKEIGYQRKGANQKFYEDGKWEDPEKCVVTKEELDFDIVNYFSDDPPSQGGWGSFTEYSGISDEDRRQRFIDNIASKFIPGETAVMYW
jgi:hypothetical protein